MGLFRDRHGDDREDPTEGMYTLGGAAGRSPGRGKYRGFTRWGRSSGGIGRDRPAGKWGRAKSQRGRPR